MTERYGTSAQTATVDRARTHAWLSQQSYWAQGRSRETQPAAVDGSWNYGVYDEDTGEQVAYARVVTDGVTFTWLCDVFVAPEVRGRGVGKMLLATVIEDLEPLGPKRTLLSTGDALGLRAQYGFSPLDDPSKMMARSRESIGPVGSREPVADQGGGDPGCSRCTLCPAASRTTKLPRGQWSGSNLRKREGHGAF